MLLKADKTNISVDGNNVFETSGENAVLSKNISVNKVVDSSRKCTLQIPNGKLLICGAKLTETDRKYLIVLDEQIEYINETQYENMLNSHYIHFDSNGGEIDIDKKLVMWNSKIGTLPIPTRENCTFDGWFTEGGIQVTSDTIFTELKDMTVKAHWTSRWVLAETLPSDATVVNQKWTYDLTTTKTSSNSSEPGYTLYNTTSEWGPYGNWSGWSRTQYGNSDSRQVESQDVPAVTKTQYHYYRYAAAGNKWTSYAQGTYSGFYCGTYQETDWLDYQLTIQGWPDGRARYGSWGTVNSNYWYNEETRVVTVTPAYTQYRYRDRSLIYTYHHMKTEAMESNVEVVPSDSISNVQKWVQYIAK